ncbi:MAG: hypothetical protein LBM18_00160 [Oscillospiraceae bacterium]|jgi:hypothetical protein|nr:hypothetical protein [Oscillospiraceae bacterium]
MIANTILLFVVLIVTLAIFAGIIILQVYLSKKESKILGLILPGVFFLLSFIPVLGLTLSVNSSGFYLSVFFVFLLSNLPTLILLAIYFANQTAQKRRAELEKMNKRDL